MKTEPKNTLQTQNSKLRLLVVDDDNFMRRTVVGMGKKLGWHVDEASSVPAALDLPDLTRFDLIVSDVQMPEATGPELIQRIRNRALMTPVILMSGSFQYNDEWALHQHANAFLPKPFHLDDLQFVIQKTLASTFSNREK